MAETLTITLPDDPEKRERILRFLREQGLVEAPAEPEPASPLKGKWALLAETMAGQAFMDGDLGNEVLQSIQAFRDDFEIPDPLDLADK